MWQRSSHCIDNITGITQILRAEFVTNVNKNQRKRKYNYMHWQFNFCRRHLHLNFIHRLISLAISLRTWLQEESMEELCVKQQTRISRMFLDMPVLKLGQNILWQLNHLGIRDSLNANNSPLHVIITNMTASNQSPITPSQT